MQTHIFLSRKIYMKIENINVNLKVKAFSLSNKLLLIRCIINTSKQKIKLSE